MPENTLAPPPSGSSAPPTLSNYVLNPSLPRAWGKAGLIMENTAAARLNVVYLGDSVMPQLRESVDSRLKAEYVNGGFAGRLAGENGFVDDGNNPSAVQVTSDYTNSPNGVYWSIPSGVSKHFSVGNASNTQPGLQTIPDCFYAPNNCTRVGVWYLRRPGGGIFKVQVAPKLTTGYADVTGLTSIDTNGTLGLQYLEVAVTAQAIGLIQFVALSGGNCFVLGALVGADIGVYGHSWNVGGTSMTDQINSPRFNELMATIPADVVLTSFLDGPNDAQFTTPSNAGYTLPQLLNNIYDKVRAAFAATVVPPSVAAWAGKTALNAENPHFVFFGAHYVESTGLDQAAYNAAINAYCTTNSNTFVDTEAMWGPWRTVYDMGAMSGGDGSGSSTHPTPHFWATVAGLFLRETQLIGSAYSGFAPSIVKTLQRGPLAPGLANYKNKWKVSDDAAISSVSIGPCDILGFGDIAMLIESTGTVFECGIILNSKATNGRTYFVGQQPGGGFILRDFAYGTFFSYNQAKQMSLATNSGATVNLGPNGSLFSGLRHGVATLVAGVVTVADVKISTNTRIVLTRKTRGGTVSASYEYSVVAATSFTITGCDSTGATQTADTSTIAYMIIEP
jgi:hypothetical protein